MFIFGLHSTSDDRLSNPIPPPKAEKFWFFKSTFLTWPKYAPLNILAKYERFCTKPSEQGSFCQAGQNESKEWYAMIKTYENINISAEYQQFCMKPSEQGSIFQAGQNESKEWYATFQTYENVNISAEYQRFCTKPSEQGSFFQAGWNESKEWYATIETYENVNISVNINRSAGNLQNRAHFSKPVKMSPRSGMLRSKLMKT